MASLNLARSWLNRLDTGEAISSVSAPNKARQYTVDGDVSTWAGGRQRAMMAQGERGSCAVTMMILPASTVDKLRSWVGTTVAFRDVFGLRFVGVYFGVTPHERRGEPGMYDVEFTLLAVSTVDGV